MQFSVSLPPFSTSIEVDTSYASIKSKIANNVSIALTTHKERFWTMGTAPQSKPEQSRTPPSSSRISFSRSSSNISREVLDPFQKNGRRRDKNGEGGCVRLSAIPRIPLKTMMMLHNNQQRRTKNMKVTTTILMKLILLKDWQRVLIRCSMFPNEIEEVCIIALYRPPRLSSSCAIRETTSQSSSDILWVQVLPIHVACALQPPSKVITELLRQPSHPPSLNKKDFIMGTKIKEDGKVDTKKLPTTPLAGIPIENLGPDSKKSDDYVVKARRHNKADRDISNLHHRRHQHRNKWNNSSKSYYQSRGRSSFDNTDRDGNATNNNNNNNTYEQRHDEDEQGCRLLDDNACHNDHFEREFEHSTKRKMIYDPNITSAIVDEVVERQLPSTGRSSSMMEVQKKMNKKFSERKQMMGDTPALMTRKLRHRRNQQRHRQNTTDVGEYGELSCQLSLEESIGDVHTDDDKSSEITPDRKAKQGNTPVLIDKDENEEDDDDDNHFESFQQEQRDSEAGLPIDGWSCHSSIQFIDDEGTTDDDNETSTSRKNSKCSDDDRYEYYDAYQDDIDIDLHSVNSNGKWKEHDLDDDALLNDFLDEQGIILQLTPRGEVQPMPVQQSRCARTKVTTSDLHDQEQESVDENKSVLFSWSSPSRSGSDLQVLSSYSDSEKTTSLSFEPLDLWKSLTVGEDRVLPIHIACLYNASVEILNILISNFPDGLLVNVLGMLPIHMVTCNISFPELALSTNPSGGSTSDIYSLLQEQLDSSQERETLLIGRVRALIQHSPETLFAQSVAHAMRPLEYSKHFANVQNYQDSTNGKNSFQELVSFLEDEENARSLKINRSEKNARKCAIENESGKAAESNSDLPLISNRTNSSSTCSTVASSTVAGALQHVYINGRDGHCHNNLNLSSSSSSSSSTSSFLSSSGRLPSPPFVSSSHLHSSSLDDLLQNGQWSEAFTLLKNDYRLGRKWTYGIDHYPLSSPSSSSSSSASSGCTLWKRLPLHIVCSYNYDYDANNNNNNNPSRRPSPPPIQLVDLLIKSFRGGASCIDPHSGYTPLHLACIRRRRTRITRTTELGPAGPPGANVKWYGSNHYDGTTTTSSSSSSWWCLEMIRSLLHAAPDTTKVASVIDGRLPLHYAILSHAPYSIIETLVYHDPTTVYVPDNNGQTPFYLAQKIYRQSYYQSSNTPTTTTTTTTIIPATRSVIKDHDDGLDDDDDYDQQRQQQQEKIITQTTTTTTPNHPVLTLLELAWI